MKRLCSIILAASIGTAAAAEKAPDIFDGLLPKGKPVKGQIGLVIPPPEINKLIAKVEASARKNPEWYREFISTTTPGVPMPFHENLGLTKEEYAEYIKLWKQREFKASEEVMLLLRESSENSWILTATGKASMLSTLRYHAQKDIFRSPNGELKRIEDINASADSVLGEWTGHEWKFQEQNLLGQIKENIAIGRFADGKHGLVVYRVQELTDAGSVMLDKSLVIRFPIAATPKK